MDRFRDRAGAGAALAPLVRELALVDPVVLGLPRGGVLVALPVARTLSAPLDLLIVRKLGVPFQPELAMGALAEGGAEVVDRDLVRRLGLTEQEVEAVRRAEVRELQRRTHDYRLGRPMPPLVGRPVVVVDDGLATGLTAIAAAESLRRSEASRVVLAIPVAPASAIDRMEGHYDTVICPVVPARFRAVGEWYDDFRQVSDHEVMLALEAAALPD
jgi:putative phosphoribosyl transferase